MKNTALQFYWDHRDEFVTDMYLDIPALMEAYAKFYGERLLQAEIKLLELGQVWEDGKGYVFNGKDNNNER